MLKLLLPPVRIKIFGHKTGKFGPKYAFLVIFGQILAFFALFFNAWPKTNVNKVGMWVFRYMGNKTFDFSSKKKDFLPKNDPIWPEIGIFVYFGPGLAGSFGWWLWHAGCISQDTYLLYLYFLLCWIWQSCGLTCYVSFVSRPGSDGIPVPDPSRPENWKWLGTG